MRRASVLFLGILAVIASGIAIKAQQQPAPPTVKRETAQRVGSVSGKDTYAAYCAACHGADGRGNGPAAPALKMPPSDLTTYAKRHGGEFSEVDVREIIAGEESYVAHGSRDMPIWGDVFRRTEEDMQVRQLRVHNLIDYLKSLQKE
jgi:mono/diheme cytochrome c family protein